jgi:hypothetical protein
VEGGAQRVGLGHRPSSRSCSSMTNRRPVGAVAARLRRARWCARSYAWLPPLLIGAGAGSLAALLVLLLAALLQRSFPRSRAASRSPARTRRDRSADPRGHRWLLGARRACRAGAGRASRGPRRPCAHRGRLAEAPAARAARTRRAVGPARVPRGRDAGARARPVWRASRPLPAAARQCRPCRGLVIGGSWTNSR